MEGVKNKAPVASGSPREVVLSPFLLLLFPSFLSLLPLPLLIYLSTVLHCI